MKNSIPVYVPFLFFVLIFGSFSKVSRAATWQVGGGGDFNSIQAALSDPRVVDGNIITVAAGIYVENIDFLGKAVTLSSTNPDDPEVVVATIIDGSTPANPAYASVVTFRNGEGRDSVLAGFTLRKGKGTYAGSNSFGGGVLCIGTSPTIAKCVITDNAATHMGGGIHCEAGAGPYISDCTISQNSATNRGGGIHCNHSTVTMENCVITENHSKYGGGVYFYLAEGNTIRDSRITDNSGDSYGGGIYSRQSELLLYDSAISANRSTDGGGIYFYFQSRGTFKNCIISGNRASNGGGMFCYSSSSPALYNCVLAGNYASTSGGGLRCVSSGNPQIRNSIIWLNRPQQITQITSTPVIQYCLVQNGWGTAADHNITADPADPWNPGPEFIQEGYWDSQQNWVEVDWELCQSTAYHLSEDSSCIDTGDPNFAPEPDDKDIDGDARYCGDSMDMGIDETSPTRRVNNSNKTIWYATIQSALDAADPNDELIVNPGRFPENVVFDSQVTLQSKYPDNPEIVEATLLDGSSNEESTITFIGQTITDSMVLRGFTVAGGQAAVGGGIYCENCSPVLQQCTVTENQADAGGGIGIIAANVTITRCIIKNNAAGQKGAALAVDQNSILTIDNTAIVSHSDAVEGVLYCGNSSQAFIHNCTVKNNASHAIYQDSNAMAEVANSILWNNYFDPNDPNQIYTGEPVNVTVNYCDIENGWNGPGGNNISIDPNFAKNTETEDPNDLHDYMLESFSPCVNAGSESSDEGLDIAGNPRMAYCWKDIGAYEVPLPNPVNLPHVVNNSNSKKWYCNIQAALNEAEPGQVIVVSEGTYRGGVLIQDSNITLKGINPTAMKNVEATIIDAGGFSLHDSTLPMVPAITLKPDTAANVKIQGLTLTGGTGFLLDNSTPEDPNDDYVVGGGIFSTRNVHTTIANCRIIDNQAGMGGGICLQFSMNPTITHCTISDNSCNDSVDPNRGNGGGLLLLDCNDVTIDNCLIVDNQANQVGGGLTCVNAGGLELNFCTVAGNQTPEVAAGLGLMDCREVEIRNSIFWGNSNDAICSWNSDELSIDYCDLESDILDPNYVHDSINMDPCFLDADNGDYHLQKFSPCINRGDPGYVYVAGAVDIDSEIRRDFGYVDIGADEAAEVDLSSLTQLVENYTKGKWYYTIQEALAEADIANEIVVTPGQYLENININKQGTILRSIDPLDPEVVAATVVDGGAPTDPNHAQVITLAADNITVQGLTITNGMGFLDTDGFRKGGGILLRSQNQATIDHCCVHSNSADYGGGIYFDQATINAGTILFTTICKNTANKWGGGAGLYYCSHLRFENNLVAGNFADDKGGGVYLERAIDTQIEFCTVAGNRNLQTGMGSGVNLLNCLDTFIENSILWYNEPDQICTSSSSELEFTYSNIEGYYPGLGNLDINPQFVDAGYWDDNETEGDWTDDFWVDGDYQLQSQVEYWNEVTGSMQTDPHTSPCIDTGNPGWPAEGEDSDGQLYPGENVRVNMGHLGNTKRARKGPAGWGNRADLNNDGVVQLLDWAVFMGKWQTEGGSDNYGDISWDGLVDMADVVIMAENWLGETGWYSGE